MNTWIQKSGVKNSDNMAVLIDVTGLHIPQRKEYFKKQFDIYLHKLISALTSLKQGKTPPLPGLRDIKLPLKNKCWWFTQD